MNFTQFLLLSYHSCSRSRAQPQPTPHCFDQRRNLRRWHCHPDQCSWPDQPTAKRHCLRIHAGTGKGTETHSERQRNRWYKKKKTFVRISEKLVKKKKQIEIAFFDLLWQFPTYALTHKCTRLLFNLILILILFFTSNRNLLFRSWLLRSIFFCHASAGRARKIRLCWRCPAWDYWDHGTHLPVGWTEPFPAFRSVPVNIHIIWKNQKELIYKYIMFAFIISTDFMIVHIRQKET